MNQARKCKNVIIYGCDTVFQKEEKKKLYNILLTTSRFNNLANEMIKTKLFNLNNFSSKKNINQGEDFLINLDLFYNADKILLTNDIYYHYYKNDSSITNQIKIDNTLRNIDDLLYVYTVKSIYIKKFNINNMQTLILNAQNHSFNGICNQILRILQCKQLKKNDLIEIQKKLLEKNFYTLIKDIKAKDIKDNNLIKKHIKINVLNRQLYKNYKYKYIISAYAKLRSKNEN